MIPIHVVHVIILTGYKEILQIHRIVERAPLQGAGLYQDQFSTVLITMPGVFGEMPLQRG
jgi:hypothetical protein